MGSDCACSSSCATVSYGAGSSLYNKVVRGVMFDAVPLCYSIAAKGIDSERPIHSAFLTVRWADCGATVLLNS